MKRIYIDESLCLNCRVCEVYCRTAHSKSKDVVIAHKEEEDTPIARLFVEGNNNLSQTVMCRHCDEPLCVAACITGAMHKNSDGVVSSDLDRCIGCMTCLAVCPYGAINIGEKVVKCDFCGGEPACVKNCPNNALRYEEGGSER